MAARKSVAVKTSKFRLILVLSRERQTTRVARVADDAVALADGVVEAGQLLGARGGIDPEAELADFNLDKLAC
jgi:hypothetical protein